MVESASLAVVSSSSSCYWSTKTAITCQTYLNASLSLVELLALEVRVVNVALSLVFNLG